MKKKRIISIILIIGLLVVLVSFKWHNYARNSGYINTPNVIYLYYNGEQKQIVKNSGIRDGNGEDYFKVICELIVFKMPDKVGVDNSSFLSETSNEIKEAKEDAVGFIYNKPKKITLNNGILKQAQYKEILVVLNGKFKDNVYIKTKDNSYLFVGTRNNASYINKNIFN
jgi:hypothetical protein